MKANARRSLFLSIMVMVTQTLLSNPIPHLNNEAGLEGYSLLHFSSSDDTSSMHSVGKDVNDSLYIKQDFVIPEYLSIKHNSHPIIRNSPIKIRKPELGMGYYYGQQPYSIYDYQTFTNYFEIKGNVTATIYKVVPVKVIFDYYSHETNYGLGNTIRFQLDNDELKKLRKLREFKELEKYKMELSSMDTLQGQLISRESYLNEKLNYLQRNQRDLSNKGSQGSSRFLENISHGAATYLDSSISINQDTNSLNNSLSNIASSNQIDSFTELYSHTESTYTDSIKQFRREPGQINYTDSVTAVRKELNELKKYSEEIQTRKDSLNNLISKVSSTYIESGNKIRSGWNLDHGIRIDNTHVELGYCHPEFSPFLIYGTTLKGASGSLDASNIFLAAAGGKVWKADPLILDLGINDSISGGNQTYIAAVPKQEISLWSVKAGLGYLKGTHLMFGYMAGKMQDNTYNESVISKNSVYEIDGQYHWKKHVVSLIYGHSQTTTLGNQGEDTPGLLRETVSVGNAWNFRVKSSIPLLKSDITVNTSLIQPAFRSYGMNSFSSGKFRMDLRISHKISKSLRLGYLIREEYHGIRDNWNSSTIARMYGCNVSARISRRVHLSGSFITFRYRYEYIHESATTSTRMYFGNAVINFLPKWQSGRINFSSQYNGYYSMVKDLLMKRHRISVLGNYRIKRSLITSIAFNQCYDNVHADSGNNFNWWISLTSGFSSSGLLNINLTVDIPGQLANINDLGWKFYVGKNIMKKLILSGGFQKSLLILIPGYETYSASNMNIIGNVNVQYQF